MADFDERKFKDELRLHTATSGVFNRFFSRASITDYVKGERLVMLVDNAMIKQSINTRLADTVLRSLEGYNGDDQAALVVITAEEHVLERQAARGAKGQTPEEALAGANGRLQEQPLEQPPEGDGPETGVIISRREHQAAETPYRVLPHYYIRFWQPALGARPWQVYTVILSLENFGWHDNRLVKQNEIMSYVGISNWTYFKEARDRLVNAGMIKVEGRVRQPKVIELLPFKFLTFDQQEQQFSKSDFLRREHEAWIRNVAKLDFDAWATGADRSLWIPEKPPK